MMDMKKASSGAGFQWLLMMSWRDGKASRRKLGLFIASIVLGIAAVVSIQSFGVNLKENISLQSKALMGADFLIESDEPPNESVQFILDSLGGADGREVNFASMASFPSKEGVKLMQIRGIGGGFPFYGTLKTIPSQAADQYQRSGSALVDATVMEQFDLSPGDSIKVGALRFPIAGSLKSAPGSTAIFSAVAPPVVLPYNAIEATGLIQKGSRIEYKFYFKDPQTNLERLEENLDDHLDMENADLDTHTSTSRRLGRRYENFGKFLNLVGFIALLLGCVGIASAIHLYIRGKLPSIAVLKCLGASRKQTFLIYLIQIAVIGFLGGVLGTIGGVFLQHLFPLLLKDLLPMDIEISLSFPAIFMGLSLGVLMSILFALYPLMSTLYVSPLQALRVEDKKVKKSQMTKIGVSLGIFLFVFLFSLWMLKDVGHSVAFVAGLIVIFAVIAGIAGVVMKGIRKYFPETWSFVPRLSLLNLYRPQNQTLTLVLAIGIGTFLISTLYFTKDVLLSQARLEEQANTPNMILLDVQKGQENEVAATIERHGEKVIDDIPIVTMRVTRLKGVTVDQIRQDSTSLINHWVLNHEFRVTYRDSLIGSETLVEGKFPRQAKDMEVVPISVSEDFAQDAQVGVGDEIVFNVQGVLLKTEVGSIRAVDWARMQLNFSLVFPEGVLEEAPQFRVLTTQVANEQESARLQGALVQKFPNVTIIDLRQVLAVIQDILGKITWLINFIAFFSILTGLIVLLGAVRTSKHQRIREGVLLRTLGAKSHQIIKVIALEYLYLGTIGSLTGILLSLIASQVLAWQLFETPFVPAATPFLVLFPGITLLVMVIGMGNSIGVIKKPPLEVLRKEGR